MPPCRSRFDQRKRPLDQNLINVRDRFHVSNGQSAQWLGSSHGHFHPDSGRSVQRRHQRALTSLRASRVARAIESGTDTG
jgi:hypothetical protein